MQGVIKKWGNSAAVRIPAAVLEAANVQLEQPIDVREEGGRIIIEKLHQTPQYSLADLVAGITDQNRHEPIDLDGPAGQEVW